MSSESLVCATCQKPSLLKCGGCHEVAYCSREHQKIDWKIHKRKCVRHPSNVFKIEENELLGRFFVSTADIREGDVILEEDPLVSGPLQTTPPVCLGCYVLLNELSRRDCSKCGWPVCSERCENSDSHKSECEITTKFRKEKVLISNLGNGLNHPSYESITVLRCLYLRHINKTAWEKLWKLESHTQKRKNTEKYKKDVFTVAQFILRFFKYEEFTEEDILKAAGIVQVNAHHVPFQNPGYVSIFERASFLEHNCRANCSKSFTSGGRIVIRAARAIKRGEHLSISYTEPLLGMLARREHLLETKYFLCQCERCADPTELGTNFNSLRCLSKGCNGYMAPLLRSVIPVGNVWGCSTCERHVSKEILESLLLEISKGMSELHVTDPEICKQFLDGYGRYLHQNNHFMVRVKLSLIQCFDGERLLSASWEDLRLVINTCQNLIELAGRLVPAENRLRGVLHFHLHAAVSEFDRRRAALGEVDEMTLQKNLLTCRDILMKAYTFLKSEPEVLPEGKMAAEALKYIHDINAILRKNQLF